MWIFSRIGFYSAVCARKRDGGTDEDNILVRSRDRGHLENLKSKFNLDCAIRANEGTDYAYRMTLPKAEWARILAALAMELDYRNFKSEASKNSRQTSEAYVDALHDVWGVMLKTQTHK